MPRYTIGNVEIPVNQTTAANAIVNPAALAVATKIVAQADAGVAVDRDSLKKAKEIAAGGGDGGSGVSGGSMLVIGALVVGAGWFLLKKAKGAQR